MAVITIYKVAAYNESYKKIFSGIYNDFKNNAATAYNFELEPLSYEKFIKCIDEGLLNCLILFEDNIPTGFLVYTTVISESVELNIIHCIGDENLNEKRRLLIEKFLKKTEPLLHEKIVTYPMLGKQNSFAEEIKKFGFKIVNTTVLSFNFSDVNSINKIRTSVNISLPEDYSISNWNPLFEKDMPEIIRQSFKHSTDCLFDNRFTSEKGCLDILNKIVKNVYGEFLPNITKILLYKETPVGFCFVNMTNEKTANIPLVGISENHRGKSFGKLLVKTATEDLIKKVMNEGKPAKEINVSCDTDNKPAVSMYEKNGFKAQYEYAQAYLTKQ